MEPPQAGRGDDGSVAALQPQPSGVGDAASAAASDSGATSREPTSRGPWPAQTGQPRAMVTTPNTQAALEGLGSLQAGAAAAGNAAAVLQDDKKEKYKLRLKDARNRAAKRRRKEEETVGALHGCFCRPPCSLLVSHLMPT
eukprot:COSAG01_NODE_8238_length_2860_cov_3.532054_1_plen_140_part_10